MKISGKNILVLCDRIPPEHSATGRIAYYLAKGLSANNNVYITCLSSSLKKPAEDSVIIDYVQDRYGKYQEIIKKAVGTVGIQKFCWKIIAKLYYYYALNRGLSEVNNHCNEFEKKSKRIIDTQKIDTIISVSNPFACHVIASKLIASYPNINWYAHFMDSNRNNAVAPGNVSFEREILIAAKKLLIMPALKADKTFCEDFEGKIIVVNLPIIPIELPYKCNKESCVIFNYAGMFYDDIRNPKALFELFLKLPNNFILRLHTKGCQGIVDYYKKILGDRLEIAGFLSPDELYNSISESNILINIGNTVVNQVPSKIYDSIAYGKPILNFFQTPQDVSLADIEKYPLSKSYRYGDMHSQTIQDIVNWCLTYKDTHLDYDSSTKYLLDKRLSTVVKQIDSIIR